MEEEGLPMNARFWVPLLAGILTAAFILDLVVTLGTGESLGSLLSD